MKYKNLLFGIAGLFIVAIVLIFSRSINAEQSGALLQEDQDVIEYLQKKLDDVGVPVKQIIILKDEPLEIQAVIQSASVSDKFAPDDFEHIHMVIRESVIASNLGYRINGVSRIVVNQAGDEIDKGWIKIEPENMFRRFNGTKLDMQSTVDLLHEKLVDYSLADFQSDVKSVDEFYILDLSLMSKSTTEANTTIAKTRDALLRMAADLNSQGAGIAIMKFKLMSESDEVLFNYLFDLQFETEGWWSAEGINVDFMRHSIPAPVPTPQ